MKKKKGRSKTSRKRVSTKLAGYTRTKGKYALVFKKGTKMSVGKSRYRTKSSLVKAAKRYLKK